MEKEPKERKLGGSLLFEIMYFYIKFISYENP